MNSIIPDKKYFKIGEASQITALEPHVLRYWESEFHALSPQKDSGNQRLYTKKDLELVFEIKKLLYNENYTIAGARKKISAFNVKNSGKKKTGHNAQLKESIAQIKSQLEDIKKILST